MIGYFHRRSGLFQRVFRDAISYRGYLSTGNDWEKTAWARAEMSLPALPGDMARQP